MKTIVGLFDSYTDARNAVGQLRNAGLSEEDISLVAHSASEGYTAAADTSDAVATGVGSGATVGAVTGGVVGLLAGIGAIVIPGFGPVVAAGWLASTLTGAGVGAATGAVLGGLAGALASVGVPETEAEYYAEGVRRGGALVSVRAADDFAPRVRDILNRAGAINIEQRAEYYRTTGYTGYNPNTQPYTSQEIARERANWQNYWSQRGANRDGVPGNGIPGIQTGGRAVDGTPDTRGITEKAADALTGDRIDDKTGKRVA